MVVRLCHLSGCCLAPSPWFFVGMLPSSYCSGLYGANCGCAADVGASSLHSPQLVLGGTQEASQVQYCSRKWRTPAEFLHCTCGVAEDEEAEAEGRASSCGS